MCRYAFFVSFSFVVLYPYIYILVNSLKGSADFSIKKIIMNPRNKDTPQKELHFCGVYLFPYN